MLDDLKNLFKGNNFLAKIMVINAIVFFVFTVIGQLSLEFNQFVSDWLAMPASLQKFITRPWTIITYQFLHHGLMHLVFNLIVLFWFARIFVDFMGPKRLAGVYFLGGIAGGVLYLVIYNLLYLSGEMSLMIINKSVLVGASASIMAVIIATGAKFGYHEINLMFIGRVPLKYVALVIFLTSTFLDFISNLGGSLAHIGGAMVGWLYIRQLDKGSDWAMSFSNFTDKLSKIAEKKPKLKVVSNDHRSSNQSKTGNSMNDKERQAKTDAILDKISKSGYDNLTADEKEFLFKLSKNK